MVEVHSPRFESYYIYSELRGAGCGGHIQHPKVWVPMESPKGSAMEGSSLLKKKCRKAIIAMLCIRWKKTLHVYTCTCCYTSHIYVLGSYKHILGLYMLIVSFFGI